MLMKSYLEFFLTKNNKKIWAKKIQIIDGKFRYACYLFSDCIYNIKR